MVAGEKVPVGGGLHPPLSVIETWPKPNYVNPVTEGPALVILGIVLASIATCLVTARIYSRLFITRAPGLDDFLTVLSLFSSIALTVLVIIGNKEFGSGTHIWDVRPEKFVGNRLNVWESECPLLLYVLYCNGSDLPLFTMMLSQKLNMLTIWGGQLIATCSIKISVLLFYRRISASFKKTFVVAVWAGIVYNLGYLVAFLLDVGLICRPFKAYWMQFSPTWLETHKYKCGNEGYSLPFSAGLSVVGDFYTTALPLLLIVNLDLPRRQKAALYPLFGLGFIVVTAGIIRAYFINHLINNTYDNTWYLWKFWIWTFVELYLAIIAASAPALKPFFRRFLVEPIASRRAASSGYARGRKTSSSKGQHQLWSNATSTGNGSEDVEKIGMALGGDGTKRYELRTLESGKVEPVQISMQPQKSLDLRRPPTHTSSFNDETHAGWFLPPTENSDDTCPLRTYRAEIEALPAIPVTSRTKPPILERTYSRQNNRSVTPDHRIRSGTQQVHWHTTLPRNASQQDPHAAGTDRTILLTSELLNRSPSQGSVRAARLRAESAKRADAAAVAERRAERREMRRRESLTHHHDSDDEESDDDVDARGVSSDSNSSEETFRLPRQGAVDYPSSAAAGNGRRDVGHGSLHLPRQGSVDQDDHDGKKVVGLGLLPRRS